MFDDLPYFKTWHTFGGRYIMCFLNHELNAKFSNFILGLSHLISFSISEDRYGVVQKDLSEVISILFALEKVIFKTMFGLSKYMLKLIFFKFIPDY